MSRLLKSYGHEVIVANPHRLRLISQSKVKCDDADAELLARLGRVDPRLLAPITHTSKEAQQDMAILRARDEAVRMRTALTNHVRGVVKSFGCMLPKCSQSSFAKRVGAALPVELQTALEPLVALVGQLTSAIRGYERAIETAIKERHPEARHLQEQVHGVGPLTALCFVLTIGDPHRFSKSRTVGAYLGLVPRRDNSGANDPELPITKAGSALLRRLLVQASQYMLGPFGKDSDLQRWGHDLAARGGKNAKKRAIIAVARKLAVLLHSLWTKDSTYEPLRNTIARELAA
jgi:transposase